MCFLRKTNAKLAYYQHIWKCSSLICDMRNSVVVFLEKFSEFFKNSQKYGEKSKLQTKLRVKALDQNYLTMWLQLITI